MTKTQNDDKQLLKDSINESIIVKQNVRDHLDDTILDISKIIYEALLHDGTIFLFGNGGSAADAQHVAAELIGRFAKERMPLPAESLTTNSSVLTSIGNDYDFSEVFSRQVKARVRSTDVVIGISTSGKSLNVIKGLESAKLIGAKTIGFTGSKPGSMKNISDICLCVPSDITPRIQEAHILIWHIICELVEKKFVQKM